MKTAANLFFLATVFLCFNIAANAATYFTGNLSGAQEVPSNSSTAAGFGRVTVNDAQTQITVSVYYSGMTSGVTAGHIHGPAAVGVNGPVIFNLSPTTGVTSGSVVNATFAITQAQLSDLKAGRYYFNIHTTNFPGGEIRGQLAVDSPYLSHMTGSQENPAVGTNATGSGAISVNAAGTQAIVTMNWAGLSGNATAGHVHTGRSGTNGPIVCNLSPTAATSGSVVDFLCNFSAGQITSLRQGQFYLNVHTAANPGGEIRGQIQRRRSISVDFDGDSKTDYSVVRNVGGGVDGAIDWYNFGSTTGFASTQFGISSDSFISGDFDGDGKEDITVWRSGSQAYFYILNSANNTFRSVAFGVTGDNPSIVYDYDGDGRTDIAVWRKAAQSVLYYLPSANNPTGATLISIPWGVATDFPSSGDFDGDGRGDFCVQRDLSGSGVFYCLNSKEGFKATFWGLSTDFILPGDYDGDGKTDIAVSRSINNVIQWYSQRSLDGTMYAAPFGITGSFRTQGDYDGDGKTDFSVWQNIPSTSQQSFYVLPSNGNSFFGFQWGATSDYPVNNYNVH